MAAAYMTVVLLNTRQLSPHALHSECDMHGRTIVWSDSHMHNNYGEHFSIPEISALS